jgi:hypothetical protein
MSTGLAIAAATATLQALLSTEMPNDGIGSSGDLVTTLPPDRARSTRTNQQLNLYLYQTTIDPAWRNTNPNGKDGLPPLGLNLHYLITAYGPDNAQLEDQQVFGSAMRVLHDFPLLDRHQIAGHLPSSALHQQLERVRLSLLPMSLEELSKLWMTFQAPYRISAAFEASVVLIESKRPQKAPLPVLGVGKDKRGPVAIADRFPSLNALEPPLRQNAVRLGESFTVLGSHVLLDNLKAWIERLKPESRIGERERLPLTINQINEDSLQLTMPATLPGWGPGMYSMYVTVEPLDAQHQISSNTISLPLAPSITLNKITAAHGTVSLSVTSNPAMLENQRVFLLFGDRQIPRDPAATLPNAALTFSIPDVVARPDVGDKSHFYTVRLRVDGVDSIPIVIGAGQAELDRQQQLEIT